MNVGQGVTAQFIPTAILYVPGSKYLFWPFYDHHDLHNKTVVKCIKMFKFAFPD